MKRKPVDGKIGLKFRIDQNLSEIVEQHWQRAFQRASEILFHATNKNLQLEWVKVYVRSNSSGMDGYIKPQVAP